MTYAVIMAGGSGTRFWPMSTRKRPKQFLKLFGDRTMIQSTVDRLEGFAPKERCMVVTNSHYTQLVREQLPGLPEEFVIGEPVARNTAPCVAAAAHILFNRDADAVMAVLPADHFIHDAATFRAILDAATETARQNNALVTIGITPNRPETGYGYIRYDEKRRTRAGVHPAYAVRNFTEKPDLERAMRFIDSGDYLWNSGMFIWRAETVLQEFRRQQPEIYSALDMLGDGHPTQEMIDDFYHACPSISVDYGIMESAERVEVIPGDFGWNDVGSWTAVYELAEKDSENNSVSAVNSSIQRSAGNLVESQSGKVIALVGVENLAVVETEEAILVCNLKKSQYVRDVVEHLKSDPDLERFL